jgi:hypothetical protein
MTEAEKKKREAAKVRAANRMIVRGQGGLKNGCPACADFYWPGALHVDDCPEKEKTDADADV